MLWCGAAAPSDELHPSGEQPLGEDPKILGVGEIDGSTLHIFRKARIRHRNNRFAVTHHPFGSGENQVWSATTICADHVGPCGNQAFFLERRGDGALENSVFQIQSCEIRLPCEQTGGEGSETGHGIARA